MIILISPAKKLHTIVKPFDGEMTEPEFNSQRKTLIQLMKTKTTAELAQLMDLSPALAQLNFDRYKDFYTDLPPIDRCYPALFMFQGDVYQGLQAKSLSPDDIKYAQTHLAILSGLYGLLKPLDAIQPYRLEMGVRLKNTKGASLYDFWGDSITAHINQMLAKQDEPMLINLASNEYFKVIKLKLLQCPCVTINFYEQKHNETKMIGIYAKKARGVMAKYLIQKRVKTVEQIKGFDELGYRFNEASSSTSNLDFVRVHD